MRCTTARSCASPSAAASAELYGQLVARHGLGESHRLLLEAVPAGARVLDVGCAGGHLARVLAGRGCAVVGLERDAAAARAAESWCERVVVADVEDPGARAAAGDGFDRVLLGDVLEHLRDPVPVLRWAGEVLQPGGRVVVSLPNIAHWTGRRALVRGRFPQEDHGLFDRTHLRFFTRSTARALVAEAGLVIEREHPAGAPLPLEGRLPALRRLRAALVGARPELFALQLVLVCRA